jgi:hypothetical protein
MKHRKIEEYRPDNQDTPLAEPCAEERSQLQEPNRRELIQRYGKYAIAAAPLLLFASKAHAIHSKP